MALTYGFFNSVNHDRKYDAIQFGQIFDGIITDGVYGTYLKGMMVIASDNANEVIIQPGRAWFNHTWSYNDANLPFAAPEPEVLLDRVDTLVLDVNLEQAERQNKYLWVQGEPSSQNPQAPSLIRSVTHNQYPLCDVYRKAGTTMIYTADITNRVGTSDCPFVTGVLEGIDLDAWINQWDAEFHTWEDTTKNNFEVWMLTQQSVYTTWFNTIKDQMDTDLDEFEAWFETIKDIIDESAALHLQEEIDELKAMLPAGSHITVTTQNSELFNRNVTITDGIHEATARFDAGGSAVFESYPYVGNLTITSSDGIQTASSILNVPYFGRYSCEISFWKATVNINGGLELAGYQVTVKNSSDIVVDVISLNSDGEGVWYAMSPDTYKFSVTYGGETMEVSLNVTQETTYTVEIHGGFNYNGWLNAGDVSGTYASLDDVLADEEAVRQLMTVHASVDYLASFTADDTSVVAILNNDLAAKWITCTAYAEDVLTDAYGALMESIGKYGYGKLVLQEQVPVMTSNTTPYGEASASSMWNSIYYKAYMAFNGSLSTGLNNVWIPIWTDESPWIAYSSLTKIKVTKAVLALYTEFDFTTVRAQVEARNSSNDIWTPVSNVTSLDVSTKNAVFYRSIELTSDADYKEYRVHFLDMLTDSQGSKNIQVVELQFYAYAPLGNVPIMTSNSAPYGEASATSTASSDYPWKAFDGNSATGWSGNTTGSSASGSKLYYKFTTPVCVKRLRIEFETQAIASRYTETYVIGSNDGSTYQRLGQLPAQLNVINDVEVNNSDYYIYYGVEFATATDRANVMSLQFYGRQMTVSVPKMDSNTSPYGEASASDTYDNTGTYAAYKAFDRNVSDYWHSNGTRGTKWIRYKFESPTIIHEMYLYSENPNRLENFVVRGSDDAVTWKELTEAQTPASSTPGSVQCIFTKNIGAYQYYEVYVPSGASVNIDILQFYGFDYSEKEWDTDHPRHYIYDNGVELESLGTPITFGGATAEKRPYELVGTVVSGQNGYAFAPESAIDISPYELMRWRVGDEAYTSDTFGDIGIKATRTFTYSDNTMISHKRFSSPLSVNDGYDISSVNQSAYPMFEEVTSGSNRRMSITEWWLE